MRARGGTGGAAGSMLAVGIGVYEIRVPKCCLFEFFVRLSVSLKQAVIDYVEGGQDLKGCQGK